MPISNNASYLPTTDAFLAHWVPVNVGLGVPAPLVLKGSITLAAMQQIRAQLVSQQADVQTQRNEVQIARNAMNILRHAFANLSSGTLNNIVWPSSSATRQ